MSPAKNFSRHSQDLPYLILRKSCYIRIHRGKLGSQCFNYCSTIELLERIVKTPSNLPNAGGAPQPLEVDISTIPVQIKNEINLFPAYVKTSDMINLPAAHVMVVHNRCNDQATVVSNLQNGLHLYD